MNESNEFRKKYRSAYNAARKHNWTLEACSHMAKQHKSRNEFRKKYPGGYNTAIKNKPLLLSVTLVPR
jgi:hypothetical protein